MRLTNSLREAIMRQIMDDVPYVDYDDQMQAYVSARAVAKLPPLIKRVYEDKSLRPYLNHENHTYNWMWEGEKYYDYFNHVGDDVVLNEEDIIELTRLKKLDQEQQALHNELRQKVRNILNGVSTTQAFAKALPEFEKYVPKEDEKAKNLPALANLVSDFIKAGWPKSKEA